MMKNKATKGDSFAMTDRDLWCVWGRVGEKTEGSGNDATFGIYAEDFHKSKRAGHWESKSLTITS